MFGARTNATAAPHLRLGGRERPGAVLLVLLPPGGRKVAIEVELPIAARARASRRPSVDRALGQQAVVVAAGLGRLAADHQPRGSRSTPSMARSDRARA